MNRPLITGLLVAAGAMAMGSVACSTPDVEDFQGVNGAAASSKDKTSKDKNDDPVAEKKTVPKATTPAETAPVETTPTTTPTNTPTTPTLTPEQCQTKCVATNATSAAMDTCVNACAAGDTDCLGGCFDSTGCSVNVSCQTTNDTCTAKCFP